MEDLIEPFLANKEMKKGNKALDKKFFFHAHKIKWEGPFLSDLQKVEEPGNRVPGHFAI